MENLKNSLLLMIFLLPNITFGQAGKSAPDGYFEISKRVIDNFITYQCNEWVKNNKDKIESGELSFLSFGNHIQDTNDFYILNIKPIQIPFPDTNFVFYSVYNLNSIFSKSKVNNMSQIEGYEYIQFIGVIPKNQVSLALVAKNKTSNELIFVSGPLFLSNLDKYYVQDGFNRDEIFQILQLKFYSYKPLNLNIDMDKMQGSFYSEYFHKTFIVKFKVSKTGVIFCDPINKDD